MSLFQGRGLSCIRGGRTVFANLEFAVSKGEVLVLQGPNGSGKSTLLAILAGLDTVTSGEVFLDDHPLHNLSENERALIRKSSVAFVFQSFELLPGLTALENVMLPSELKYIYNAEEIAKDFLKRVGLEKRLNHYPKQLSGGEQQRVAIARAFACKAKVLFVDEPTGNLDSKTGSTISNLFFEVNEESSNALIVVTHDATLASKCDNQIELREGRII